MEENDEVNSRERERLKNLFRTKEKRVNESGNGGVWINVELETLKVVIVNSTDRKSVV